MSDHVLGTHVRVSELWIYAVKGLRGVSLETAQLEPWGYGTIDVSWWWTPTAAS